MFDSTFSVENQPNDNEAQTEASPFNASNLTKTNESNIFEAIDSDTELLVSFSDEPNSLAKLAPLSSISEVTLDKYPTS